MWIVRRTAVSAISEQQSMLRLSKGPMETVMRRVLQPLLCCFDGKPAVVKPAIRSESQLSKSTLRFSPSAFLEKEEVSSLALLGESAKAESQEKHKRRPKVFPLRGNVRTLVYYKEQVGGKLQPRKSRTLEVISQVKELRRRSASAYLC